MLQEALFDSISGPEFKFDCEIKHEFIPWTN